MKRLNCKRLLAQISFATLSLVVLSGQLARAETTRTVNVANVRSDKSVLELPIDEVLKDSPLRVAIEKYLSPARMKTDPPRTPSNQCDAYLKDDGSLGKLGKVAQAVLQRSDFKLLKTPLAHTDIASFCPNFPRMNETQKNGFWIWVIAGIEWGETSCGAQVVKQRQPSGGGHRLVGRLQIPDSKKLRFALSSRCDEITTDGGQLTCGYSFIFNQINRSSDAALLSPKAYYAILRPKHPMNAAFRSYLSAFPACGN